MIIKGMPAIFVHANVHEYQCCRASKPENRKRYAISVNERRHTGNDTLCYAVPYSRSLRQRYLEPKPAVELLSLRTHSTLRILISSFRPNSGLPSYYPLSVPPVGDSFHEPGIVESLSLALSFSDNWHDFHQFFYQFFGYEAVP